MTTTDPKAVAYMTGPQHYAEAEHLLAKGTPDVYALAQVHATLALAAATAATITVEGVIPLSKAAV